MLARSEKTGPLEPYRTQTETPRYVPHLRCLGTVVGHRIDSALLAGCATSEDRADRQMDSLDRQLDRMEKRADLMEQKMEKAAERQEKLDQKAAEQREKEAAKHEQN